MKRQDACYIHRRRWTSVARRHVSALCTLPALQQHTTRACGPCESRHRPALFRGAACFELSATAHFAEFRQAAMGRMHAPGKGISGSALPYKKTPPSWLKTTASEVRRLPGGRVARPATRPRCPLVAHGSTCGWRTACPRSAVGASCPRDACGSGGVPTPREGGASGPRVLGRRSTPRCCHPLDSSTRTQLCPTPLRCACS